MNLKEVKQTLNYLLDNNLKLAEAGAEKIAINLVGDAGIGKTAILREIADERGAGYKRLNLSELEELGDLCGLPLKKYAMHKNGEEKWVAEKIVDRYINMGWELCEDCEPQMDYAIPEWVPTNQEQEFLLVLDDFSRANTLFMQATMSLIQFGEYNTWKLPKKCHLLLSSNPDDAEYSTTALDPAQRSRMINFNVEFDMPVYAKWMSKNNINPVLQNFALMTPEIFSRDKRINARSYTMFANALSGITNFEIQDNLEMVCLIAKGCFSDDYVSELFVQFVNNKLDQLIEPEEILKGDWDKVKAKLIDNIYRNNGNYDASVASTLTMRFTNYIENYFTNSLDKNKSQKAIDRIIDIVTNKDKDLLTEDLIFRMVVDINAKFPTRCTKLLMYPEIRQKLLS